MEGCYGKGLDVTGGGTVYNNSGVNLCGMANVVDSLNAIRRMVFEEKSVTLSTLAEAMRADFAGYEDLQNELIRHCPKYGNDQDDADDLMNDWWPPSPSWWTASARPGAASSSWGSTPWRTTPRWACGPAPRRTGRNARVSLANAMSPVQGRDHVGPTAVVNSVLKTDLSVATNGMVLDLKFSPAFLESAAHMDALRT